MISMPEAVSAAGFAMLLSLVAKGVVLLAAALALNIALRRASAALRHQVWSLALLGLLGLPVLSAMLPSWEVATVTFYPDINETNTAPRVAPAAAPGREVARDREAAQYASAPVVTASPRGGVDKPSVVDDRATAAAQSATPPTQATAVEAGPDAGLFTWALTIWIAGALIVLARLLAGTAAVWWMTRRADLVKDSEWLGLAEELSRRLEVKRRAVLLTSDRVTMPLTCGLFRAAILLPAEAVEWTGERRRIVLLHELAHVKRRDCLIQALAHLACAMHWFNPLIWLSVHRMRIEREMACDDHVLDTGTKATDYAGHLLDIARRFHSARCPSFAAVAIARRSQLEGRLLAILDPGMSRRGLNRTASSLIALAAVSVIVALSVLQPLARAESKRLPPDVVARVDSERDGATQAQPPIPADPEEEQEPETPPEVESHPDVPDAPDPESEPDMASEPAPPEPTDPAQPGPSSTQADRNATADALLLALKDEDPEVREYALMALGQLGGPQMAEALKNALKDPDPRVRVKALHAAAVGRGGDFTEEMIAGIKDEDRDVRERAAWALGLKGNQRAVDPLISALKDEDAGVRERAAWALGLKGDRRAVEPLIDALSDGSANVREKAAWALGLRGDQRAMKPLQEAMKDQNEGVRDKAKWALGLLLMRGGHGDGLDIKVDDARLNEKANVAAKSKAALRSRLH